MFVVDTERQICDIFHSSRCFLEKCFLSLINFRAIMLKDSITTCTKISVGIVAIVGTPSYPISSQITVPVKEEGLEMDTPFPTWGTE